MVLIKSSTFIFALICTFVSRVKSYTLAMDCGNQQILASFHFQPYTRQYTCVANFMNIAQGDVLPDVSTPDCYQYFTKQTTGMFKSTWQYLTGPNCHSGTTLTFFYNQTTAGYTNLYIQKIYIWLTIYLFDQSSTIIQQNTITINGNQTEDTIQFDTGKSLNDLRAIYTKTIYDIKSKQLNLQFKIYDKNQAIYPFGFAGSNVLLQFCPLYCLQCDDNSCLVCSDGYILNASNTCVRCTPSCQTCDQSGCLTCQQPSYYISVLANNLCVSDCDTSLGLYIETSPTTNSKYCKKCNALCQSCTDSTLNCVCKLYSSQDQCVNTCQASEVQLPNNSGQSKCYPCDSSCSTCNGTDKTQCTACNTNYLKQISTSLCVKQCDPSEYPDYNLNQCLPCDKTCLTCNGPSNKQCLKCKDSSFFFNGACVQICPNGYQKNFSSLNCDLCTDYQNPSCYSCDNSCFECTPSLATSNQCTSCYSQTRKFDSNLCKCLNQKDQRNIFYHCSYQDIAVLDMFLSGNIPQLIIDFGSPIKSLGTNISSPQDLCKYVFDQNTMKKIGNNSSCSLQGNQIQVDLDQSSTIMENDQINFQQGTLQFTDYNMPITQFFRNKVKQYPYGKPQVLFFYDSTQNTCNPFNITLNKIVSDAGRGLLNFSWSLVEVTGNLNSSQLQAINQAILQNNQLNNTSLVLSPGIFPSNQNITIKFSYTLKVNYTSSQVIQIFYKKEKIIRISYLQSIYPPIYRYMALSFYFSFVTEICDQGQVFQFYDPVDLQITSSDLTSIQQSIQNYSQSTFDLNISPYSLPSNQTFNFMFQLSLTSDNSIKTIQNVSVDILITKLFVMLQGGSDQIASYQRPFNLNSTSRDYEVQSPTADQSITFNWICQSLGSSDQNCYDYNKQKIILQQGQSSISIPASTFPPYTVVQLSVQVSKDTRKSSDIAFCYFSELDLPPLLVLTPIQQTDQKFNLNEDLEFSLIYSSQVSSDILSYAGALLYKNNVVGAIKFDYYKVRFRIWNYFKQIDPTQSTIQVRFSVYNPSYVMPSVSTITIQINIPPQNCILKVNPQQGIALETNFSIEFSNCSDEDTPLKYQFFYYNTIDDLNSEIDQPWNIVRRQLNDQSMSNILQTILPQGNLIIMSQVIDSRLGVTNSTLSIQVYSQNLTDSNYYQMANKLIQQNQNSQTSNQIANLCIIGEDVSKNSQYDNSQIISNLKTNLVANLQQQSQTLPQSSLISTYSNKVIAQLQQSIITQSDQQKNSIYNQVQSIISNTQNNNVNQFQKNNDLQIQNLVDSFKILNSTVTQNTNNQQSDFTQYNNLTNQIGSILSNSILPNQGELILQGNLSTLLSDQITQKNLKQYALPFDSDNQLAPSSANTFVITRNTYQENIYQNTSSFQAYVQKLNNLSSNFNYSNNQVITTSINSTQTKNPITNSTIMYQFNNAKASSKYNMTCLQSADQIWTKQNCSILKQNSNNYACFCQKQAPTTVIEDLDDLFVKNKNLQTVFSDQGIKNLENFSQFYLYISFWMLSIFTINQIVLFFVGRYLDQKTITRINNKNNEEEQKSLVDKYQQQIKNLEQKIRGEQSKDCESENKSIQSTQKVFINQKSNSGQNQILTSPFQAPTNPLIQVSNNQEDDFNIERTLYKIRRMLRIKNLTRNCLSNQ
ncbi:REJ domain protein (macronuclear) [Tetrahymena thermophila SB210]|uniref:REJ domain protein n=1 Tax=Tetrahymena thermophila (strain SB210) TaxID=312017 RepID=I7M8F3_TETTS|nr:REJ domain protein [Tetrahymena thermophila SB210]EAR97969.2 REJ domain protein [Tetrahymena thermophila SB210]|eukprot:XP_001018214.2 REJ domain protein [Tetrahymena thermophila SB210]